VFSGGYVLGDASYVNSLTCNATGSYRRVDTSYSRAFLKPVPEPLAVPPPWLRREPPWTGLTLTGEEDVDLKHAGADPKSREVCW
jgi:hypothetical protein